MSTPIVIGLDLGTTHCKALALTPEGAVAGKASAGYSLRTPRPGWAEQDPAEVWHAAQAALRALLAELPRAQPAGLCLSGAMHSLLLVDAAGQPLAPALTWADGRASPQAQQLSATAEAAGLYARTGCPVQPVYHPAKLRWWHAEAPQLAARAACFAALKDWVLYCLTGELVTDLGLASTTGLLDIHALRWDEAALALAGVTPARLPRLAPPDAVAGRVSAQAAAATGLPAGLPVVAGSSDGGLANLGSGASEPGAAVITVGTSGAVRRVLAQPWLDPAERTWCYVLRPGVWFAGGAINNAGLAVQWVRERFYADLPGQAGYERLLGDAAAAPPGAAGVRLLPYFTGERSPHWNPEARALLAGLRLAHTRAHIARAALEGVAFCLRDVWQAVHAAQAPAAEARLTGSITAVPAWAQLVADVLGQPLAALEAADASALGAALLGLSALHPNAAATAAPAVLDVSARFTPDPERHAFYAERHREFQALYTALVAPAASIPMSS